MSIEHSVDGAGIDELTFNCIVLISCLRTLNREGTDRKSRLNPKFRSVFTAVDEMTQSGRMSELLDPTKRDEFPQSALFAVMPENLWQLETVGAFDDIMKLVDQYVSRESK